MHLRALIVLLLVMNVGVALWWALRPAPAAEPPPALQALIPDLHAIKNRYYGEMLDRGEIGMKRDTCAWLDPAARFQDRSARGLDRRWSMPIKAGNRCAWHFDHG